MRNHIIILGSIALGSGAVLFLGNGCGNVLLQQKLTEGVIEYALTFPEYDPMSLMADMLPERTTLSFNETQQAAELSAGMGVFRTSMVVNNESKSMDYHLSVLSKKLVSHLLEKDVALMNKEEAAMAFIWTDDIDTIAGYPCKKAIAVYDGVDEPEIELWYTDRIQVKDPNWFGPYRNVPGVLLRSTIVQYGMRMHLDAVSITPGPVDPSKFEVKQDHESVPPAVLQHELNEVLGTFSI
jgi:GLPGLI family protein